MKTRVLALLVPLSLAGTAFAQSTLPSAAASDSWSKAPPAVNYDRAASGAGGTAADTAGKSHFKFRQARSYEPGQNLSQQESGKAAVIGPGMGRDGRPAVSCSTTPMDPACR
jgi:hypothetical protein